MVMQVSVHDDCKLCMCIEFIVTVVIAIVLCVLFYWMLLLN